MVAGTAPAFNAQANKTLAHCAQSVFARKLGRAGEHGPVSCFYRSMIGVQVLAIQGQAYFQTQGVSRSKPCRAHTLIIEQGCPQARGFVPGQIDFIAQFPGIACAADKQ